MTGEHSGTKKEEENPEASKEMIRITYLIESVGAKIKAFDHLLERYKQPRYSTYTVSSLTDKLSQIHQQYAIAEKLNTELCTLVPEAKRAGTRYFDENHWNTLVFSFDQLDELISDKIDMLYKQRDAEAAAKERELSMRTSTPNRSSADQSREHFSSVKLPKLPLTPFSGAYEEWQNFFDTFTNAVDKHPALSPIEKMQHLKASLHGDAALVISALPLSHTNYPVAWKALCQRYDNKRVHITNYLNKLAALPTVTLDSLTKVRHMRDTMQMSLDALTTLGCNTDEWGPLLIHNMTQKFSIGLRREWEKSLAGNNEFPTFAHFTKFMNEQVHLLENMDLHSDKSKERDTPKPASSKSSHNTNVKTNKKCILCGEAHALHACEKFKTMTVQERQSFRLSHKLCANCLNKGHPKADCQSKYKCRTCRLKHHTLLHNDQLGSKENPKQGASQGSSKTTETKINTLAVPLNSDVLLATILVKVTSPGGRTATVRAMVDTGSESTFISESLVQAINLPRKPTDILISGLQGVQTGVAKHYTTFDLMAARSLSPVYTANAYILQSITTYRAKKFYPLNHDELRGLSLADPEPYKDLPIDILLGADMICQFLQSGVKKLSDTQITAQNTTLGWILQGPIEPASPEKKTIHVRHATTELVEAIERFWRVEEVGIKSPLTEEEQRAEEIFASTTTRNKDGRYVVRLPFISEEAPQTLGESRRIAEAAWKRVQTRLSKTPGARKQYDDFMLDYLERNHMTEIPENQVNDKRHVFLPHHAVFRENSTSTKLRVVYNASSPTRGGKSLNDTLCTGPKLQNDISDVMINWRLHPYVFGADIEKMYRQIEVHEDDRHYQCIVWNAENETRPKFFRLNTVTYGTRPAPYLANRVIKEVIKDHSAEYPLAVEPLEKLIYVDDVFFGAQTIEAALEKKTQIEALLQRGCLQLRKWIANDKRLLPDAADVRDTLYLEHVDKIKKILGIAWSPEYDAFTMTSSEPSAVISKRTILSQTASLFDPLGFISPFVVRAKLLFQSLWLLKHDWDDENLPEDVKQSWKDICNELKDVDKLRIPRLIGRQDRLPTRVRLVGFSDASSRAYSAAVYSYLEYEDHEIKSSLLCAKTRVAPVKTLSIPRLELCGALLLAELMAKTRSAWLTPVDELVCYTDSRIVLDWLNKHASTWKTFVANKVAAIQTLLPQVKWLHVTSKQNPADLNSRGLSMLEVLDSKLWWHGPKLPLGIASDVTPEESQAVQSEVNKEQKSKNTLAQGTVIHKVPDFLQKHSRWDKLVRALAFWLKFKQGARKRVLAKQAQGEETEKDITELPALALTREQIRMSEAFIFRELQQMAYAKEVKACREGKPVDPKSKLHDFCPFLDDDGVLRMEGRLTFSEEPFDTKHPILLPQCRTTKLLIQYCHIKTLHGGPQVTLTLLRQRFYIPLARNTAKAIIAKCTLCVRYKGQPEHQKMAPMPKSRSSIGRPFSRVGVDYAGPLMMRNAPGRGYKAHKVWLAIFVCFASRAIHIEVVDDCTSTAFLAALACFAARRGSPHTIYSDCAPTFKGAANELERNFYHLSHDPDVLNTLVTEGIEWVNIPPKASHQGGLWESAVRAVKHHLLPIIGKFTPMWSEMRTIVCKIEACLNSRPLTPSTDFAKDGPALTPGHFLVGTSMMQIAERSTEGLNENLLTRWQTVQRITEIFWKRWRNEYLQQLQKRLKWQDETPNLKEDDIVLVTNEDTPPGDWPLAKVLSVRHGTDGFVRDVQIQIGSTTLVRPITKLIKLPVD